MSALPPASSDGARSLDTLVRVDPLPGSGILRPFPSASLPHLDPFVFLDTGAPMHLEGDIFVAPHAHRGVQPVSLLFRGRIQHRDSLGNDRVVTSGGMQWLVAGAGALHEETLHGDDDGVFHMAQLWVNVPNARKLDPPAHHAVGAEDVPSVALADGVSATVYAGALAGVVGPAPLPTPVCIALVQLAPGSQARLDVPAGWTAAGTVVEGVVDFEDQPPAGPGATAVFADDGAHLDLRSSKGGALLVLLGAPIGEPVVFGGGFVMTTEDDVATAFADLRRGAMGTLAPSR